MAQINRPKTSPKDFFLHLLNIVTLYISAVGFGRLLYLIINNRFFDPLQTYYSGAADSDSMRWAIASMIIAFPIYIWSAWVLKKEYATDPEKKNLRVKLWLEYFTMFGTAIVIITDLMTLVYYLLGGEVTIRFSLKVLTVLYIAGAIFGYYFYMHREERKNEKNVIMGLLIANIAIMLIAIIGGFIVVGSPAKARDIKFDTERINSLSNIQSEVINYWQRKRSLPATTDVLASESYFTAPVDPITGAKFEYNIKDALTFELCADFTTGKPKQAGSQAYPVSVPVMGSGPYQGLYNADYTAGRNCFPFTINPDFYPPTTPNIIK